MDLHQYEAFYIVARERSFSRAADILHVSQSAISTRIANLESELGVNLFLRNGK
jgi:DNA-binding transcriptional LysR family regulator